MVHGHSSAAGNRVDGNMEGDTPVDGTLAGDSPEDAHPEAAHLADEIPAGGALHSVVEPQEDVIPAGGRPEDGNPERARLSAGFLQRGAAQQLDD